MLFNVFLHKNNPLLVQVELDFTILQNIANIILLLYAFVYLIIRAKVSGNEEELY